MKQNIKKTNLLIVLLSTTLLSTVTNAAIPKTALLKAEPINQSSLTRVAISSLKVSFATANMNYNQQVTQTDLAKKKQAAKQNKVVTVANISLMTK